MNDQPEREYFADDDEPALVVQPAPVPKKGWPWIAWPLILAMVTFLAVSRQQAHEEPEEPEVPGGEPKLESVVERMQARYAVGAANSPLATGEQRSLFLEQLRSFDHGALPQRLRYAVLVGELSGPKEALKYLDDLQKEISKQKGKPPTDVALLGILRRLYRDYERGKFDAPSLRAAERTQLAAKLGWFGDLALAPAGKDKAGPPNAERRQEVLAPALRTFWTTLAAVGLAVLLALLGFVGLIVFLVLAGAGKLRDGLPDAIRHGGVYAETFALWLFLFGVLSFVAHVTDELPVAYLLRQCAAMFLSLLALVWPVVRGIPWAQVRRDVGLTLGRQPLLEPAIGVGSYLISLPLLGLGLIVVLALMFLERMLQEAGGGEGGLGPVSRAAHPIVQFLASGDWGLRLQILFLASVAAPIVEETMFRGVLYRHLREATRGVGVFLSFLVAATVVSFIFAVIHPQGLIAVPLLMALAFGFTMAREWRGTLIPCMVAHGLNNGLVTLLAMLALGD
jgi:membrane protease YdiL (CAAX protease family)